LEDVLIGALVGAIERWWTCLSEMLELLEVGGRISQGYRKSWCRWMDVDVGIGGIGRWWMYLSEMLLELLNVGGPTCRSCKSC
jgi:hypothetical protein